MSNEDRPDPRVPEGYEVLKVIRDDSQDTIFRLMRYWYEPFSGSNNTARYMYMWHRYRWEDGKWCAEYIGSSLPICRDFESLKRAMETFMSLIRTMRPATEREYLKLLGLINEIRIWYSFHSETPGLLEQANKLIETSRAKAEAEWLARGNKLQYRQACGEKLTEKERQEVESFYIWFAIDH